MTHPQDDTAPGYDPRVALLQCALAWEAGARLVGNVTAANVAKIAALTMTQCPACGSEAWVNIDCDVCAVVGRLVSDVSELRSRTPVEAGVVTRRALCPGCMLAELDECGECSCPSGCPGGAARTPPAEPAELVVPGRDGCTHGNPSGSPFCGDCNSGRVGHSVEIEAVQRLLGQARADRVVPLDAAAATAAFSRLVFSFSEPPPAVQSPLPDDIANLRRYLDDSETTAFPVPRSVWEALERVAAAVAPPQEPPARAVVAEALSLDELAAQLTASGARLKLDPGKLQAIIDSTNAELATMRKEERES